MTHFTTDEIDSVSHSVFAGLVPSADTDDRARRLARHLARVNRSMKSTVPIILVGSLAAATFSLTGPVESANAKTPHDPRLSTERANKPTPSTMLAVAAVAVPTVTPPPATYVVVEGDTVSDIASRYGLSTASVLALNGLSWSSKIFPAQELTLAKGSTAPRPSVRLATATNGDYTIVIGDTVSGIAGKFGVSTVSLLSANGLGWSSIIYPGQSMVIPGRPNGPTDETEEYDFTLDQDDSAEGSDSDTPITSETAKETADSDSGTGADIDTEADSVDQETDAATAPSDNSVADGPVSAGDYSVVSGDTISSVAGRAGISVDALLDVNDLSRSSVIFIGDVLTVPATGSRLASNGDSVTYLTTEMSSNAEVIIQVGRELGVSDYGITIALATAMQESSLRNLNWGDRDSVGLFQQRPSMGWGTVDDLTTPAHAASLFYGGANNPNLGITRGLLEISGWENLSLTDAAQAVQISAYPNAYAQWETSARSWLQELG